MFIGGLAVKFYLKQTERFTKDIDVVVTTRHLDKFHTILESEKYNIGDFSPWFKAIKHLNAKTIILDFTGEHVPDLDSFYSFKVDFKSIIFKKVLLDDSNHFFFIPLPRLEELLILKLLSCREKDMMDILLFLLEKKEEIDFEIFQRRVQLQDLERPIFSSYTRIKTLLTTKDFPEFWNLTFNRRLEPEKQQALLKGVTKLEPL